ncbi:MAG: hypothetical protein JNL67_10630 [Planctomycetaceae bacterium]|nr:hypothetical protein [Planctomycetaceae bacterium]
MTNCTRLQFERFLCGESLEWPCVDARFSRGRALLACSGLVFLFVAVLRLGLRRFALLRFLSLGFVRMLNSGRSLRVLTSGFNAVRGSSDFAGPGSTFQFGREFASAPSFRQKFFRLFGVWQLSFSDRLLGFFGRQCGAQTLRESG